MSCPSTRSYDTGSWPSSLSFSMSRPPIAPLPPVTSIFINKNLPSGRSAQDDSISDCRQRPAQSEPAGRRDFGERVAHRRKLSFKLPDSRHERMVLGFERCLQVANARYRGVTLRCLRALRRGYLIGMGAALTVQVRLELPDSRDERMVLGFE